MDVEADEAEVQITLSPPHVERRVICLVCHVEVPWGEHIHITSRDWETCGYCSEGHAIQYAQRVSPTAVGEAEVR